MNIIRITKEFKFEMAHALLNYDGPCRNIHGHSYYLYVTLSGRTIANDEDPHNGMVMDFTLLKKLIHDNITNQLDHSLVLYDKTPAETLKGLSGFENIVLLPYQPTCENMLIDFASRIKKILPEHLKLHHLKLCETVTSSAEWFAEDND
jgi:6-pyruvoyltetrahydropterin/6-carboxytetrahydropterin synthase